MNLRTHRVAVCLAAVVCLGLAAAQPTTAQVMGLGAPMTVRFEGTFRPYAEDEPRGPNTLQVTIGGDKSYFFAISSIGSYMGSDPSMMLIHHIFPPMLEFMGPAQRLKLLADPAPKKKYVLEGWLYAGDNTFYVAAVKPPGS